MKNLKICFISLLWELSELEIYQYKKRLCSSGDVNLSVNSTFLPPSAPGPACRTNFWTGEIPALIVFLPGVRSNLSPNYVWHLDSSPPFYHSKSRLQNHLVDPSFSRNVFLMSPRSSNINLIFLWSRGKWEKRVLTVICYQQSLLIVLLAAVTKILDFLCVFTISALLYSVSSVSRHADYTGKVLSAGGAIILIVGNDWNYQK